MKRTETMVSVCTLTYNHAPFLRQCLDGILMQQTDFAFEILIHDDASTDGTQDIIREYERNYPDIVKPIYQTENQFSKGVKISTTYQYPRAKGKYIALCEGDDYWTDPHKLQRQVDFLESHLDYSMCFHKVGVETDKDCLKHLYDSLEIREYHCDEIMGNWIVPTCSVVFRKEIYHLIPQDKRLICGDIVLFLTAGSQGRVFCIEGVMGVYRRLSSGLVLGRYTGENGEKKWIAHFEAMRDNFPSLYGTSNAVVLESKKWRVVNLWSTSKKRCLLEFFKYARQERWSFVRQVLAHLKYLLLKGFKKDGGS